MPMLYIVVVLFMLLSNPWDAEAQQKGGGGGGGGTQYAEDTAHTTGDTGTLSLGVRRDANTTLADTTGDYAPFQLDANGNVKVAIITGAGSGGTALTDDAAFTAGSTSGTPMECLYNDAATLTSTNAGVVRCTSTRLLMTSSDTELGTAVQSVTDAQTAPTAPWVNAYLHCRTAGANTVDRCLGGLSDTDDGSIAVSQVPSLNVSETYAYDLTTWTRFGNYTAAEDAAETAGMPLAMVGAVRRDVAAVSSGTTGDNSTVNVDALGLLWTRGQDPCNGVAKVAVPFSITTATTTQLVAASASNKVYVCSIHAVTAAANNVALVEDDTSACASPTAGMAGGTTGASGWNLAANGGLALGTGYGTVAVSAATNRYVCFITTAATQLSGTVMYALAP